MPNPDSKATELKGLSEKNGYFALGIENIGLQPSIKQPQLRYFRNTNARLADEICKFLAKHGINAVATPIGGYENSPLIRQKQFELWFTSDPIPDVQ
jgi:hypothetical protein